jgi:hypothetical protein
MTELDCRRGCPYEFDCSGRIADELDKTKFHPGSVENLSDQLANHPCTNRILKQTGAHTLRSGRSIACFKGNAIVATVTEGKIQPL